LEKQKAEQFSLNVLQGGDMKSTVTAEIFATSKAIREFHLSRGTWVLIAALVMSVVPAYATFPGVNGRIAFQVQVTPDAQVQIYTVRPNGHDLRQITDFTDADAVTPDWSPDGRQIAFEIDRDHEPFCGIALMNADGSNIVELTPAEFVCENDPHFTPDGARIVFDRFDGVDEAFWIMDITGNNRQRLGQCCADPTPSPNGEKFSYVAFQDEENFLTALYTANIDGSNPQPLTPFDFGVAVKQDWAPDGRHLVFTKNGIGHPPGISANIATIRPDGTGLQLLTHFQGGDVQALVGSYSPDGRWIVFRLEDHGRFGLYKMRPDGSHMRAILPLSDFKPRVIAWGAKPIEAEDEDEGK
jgi:Tol biopolymer transport system component